MPEKDFNFQRQTCASCLHSSSIKWDLHQRTTFIPRAAALSEGGWIYFPLGEWQNAKGPSMGHVDFS